MTDYVVSALRSPVAAPASAVSPVRDPILTGHNGGVRFLADLDFSYCYPGGAYSGRPAAAAPTSGQAIYDIAGRANGQYLRQGATPVATYSGGGFDYTPVTDSPFGCAGPVDAWNSIYGQSNRYFLWIGYYRLPTSGDWKASNGNFPIFESTPNNSTYISNPDPLVVFQITPSVGNPQLVARRQIALGGSNANASVFTLVPTADYFGELCQVAFWRTATEQVFRMKSVLNSTEASQAAGAETALNFSGIAPVWGRSPTPNNGSMNSEDQAAANFRFYRGCLEDLVMSGRSPRSVADADWTRVQARIAASAAANGGTSLIFV